MSHDRCTLKDASNRGLRRRARRRSCSLLVGLLYALTAAQVAVFVIALWQNGWQLENLRNNPWVRALAQRPACRNPTASVNVGCLRTPCQDQSHQSVLQSIQGVTLAGTIRHGAIALRLGHHADQSSFVMHHFYDCAWQVGPSEKALHAMGSLSTADVVDNHQYWRLVTSIFLCPGVCSIW